MMIWSGKTMLITTIDLVAMESQPLSMDVLNVLVDAKFQFSNFQINS